jgi:hypothetical protein
MCAAAECRAYPSAVPCVLASKACTLLFAALLWFDIPATVMLCRHHHVAALGSTVGAGRMGSARALAIGQLGQMGSTSTASVGQAPVGCSLQQGQPGTAPSSLAGVATAAAGACSTARGLQQARRHVTVVSSLGVHSIPRLQPASAPSAVRPGDGPAWGCNPGRHSSSSAAPGEPGLAGLGNDTASPHGWWP